VDRSGALCGIERQTFGTEVKLAIKIVESARNCPLRVRVVALARLLQNSAFGPDEIKRMTTAYEDALRVLGFVDRTDAITEIVAKKVIEIAQTGERDPFRIRARAIADVGIPIMPEDGHTQVMATKRRP
jgi:hypothetical protein